MRPAAPLALALLAVSGLGACGDGDPVDETEEGVAAVLADRLDVPTSAVQVTCPDDVDLDPGVAFGCEIAVGEGAAVTVDLVVADDGTIELQRAVIPTDAAEAYLAGELAPTAEGPVSVDCGEEHLLVRSVGETFECTATRTADAVAFHVVVDVTSVDGSVHYRVERTTTTVATTATTAGRGSGPGWRPSSRSPGARTARRRPARRPDVTRQVPPRCPCGPWAEHAMSGIAAPEAPW